jgi:hypothetical protein
MPTVGVRELAAANGTVFYSWSGQVGPAFARMIRACALSGCTTPAKLTDTPVNADVVDMVADSSGVYWAVGGDQGAIWMCPGQACVGGARKLAENQANPFSLQLQGDFVYWGAMGVADGGEQRGLRRVAKPIIE